ncbi:hypothetical protein KEM56_003747 [Ascosphaera pollenicola]|nr:hypothetical protein KEM56_003747 [Ascosphaera pollenicola]
MMISGSSFASSAASVLASLLLLSGLQLVPAKIDFITERPHMNTDYSKVRTDAVGEKYFREAQWHYHYDGRFATKQIEASQKLPHLRAMTQSYLATMADVGVDSWIMHGTLLGWWWNQKIMPWDSDLDVQVSESALYFLADHYNMTQHEFRLDDGTTRRFLLEINPNFVLRTKSDVHNVIDARWIDMSSGLFIDITGVRKDYEARAKGDSGALMCKDYHRYQEDDLFPLRDSYFEGIPVKIPYAYNKLLIDEYGEKALTETHFEHHDFNYETKEWEPMTEEDKKIEEQAKKEAEEKKKKQEEEKKKQEEENKKQEEENKKQEEENKKQEEEKKKQEEAEKAQQQDQTQSSPQSN